MNENISIADCVEKQLKRYFADLDGEEPTGLYDMVRRQVELPMLRCVMDMSGQNQTRAAHMLGLNRNTLRKKLAEHGLLN